MVGPTIMSSNPRWSIIPRPKGGSCHMHHLQGNRKALCEESCWSPGVPWSLRAGAAWRHTVAVGRSGRVLMNSLWLFGLQMFSILLHVWIQTKIAEKEKEKDCRCINSALHRHRVSNFGCIIRLYSRDCLHVQLQLLQPHAFLLYFWWGFPGEKCAIFPLEDVPTFRPYSDHPSSKSWFLKGSMDFSSFQTIPIDHFSSMSQMVPNKSLSAPPKKETDLHKTLQCLYFLLERWAINF